MDTLARALCREDLMHDDALATTLIVLQTDGKGLPRDIEEMEDWKRKVLTGDVASSKRMRLIPCRGAWHRKIEQHAISLR